MLRTNFVEVIVLLIFSIFVLLPLLNQGIPLTHDGKDHLARIANFYQSLSDGNIIPRWAGNLNWGYGHPILMFLYPLPSYLASLFIFLGLSIPDSFKLVFFLSYIMSGIGMYLWTKNVFGNRFAGLVSGVLYLSAPYRFVDIYVRGAIGEHVSFVFLPFLLYFLFKIQKNEKLDLLNRKIYFLIILSSISFASLILSHNALTIMFLPIVLFSMFFLVLISNHKVKIFFISTFSIFSGFILSSFFLIPAFFEGKYTLRDIVTGKDYINHFITWNRFFITDWSFSGSPNFSFQLGWIHVLLVFLGISFITKNRTKYKNLFILSLFMFIYCIFSLFLMTKESIIVWRTLTVLQKFQFPWRFLSVIIFATSFLGAIPFVFIKSTKRTVCFITILFVSILVFNSYQWKANGYLLENDSVYKNIYFGTTDTGESAPIWSIRFMEKKANANIEFISGSGELVEKKRTSTNHIYKINAKESSKIRENTLFFPGWKVFLDNQMVNPQFQDPNNRGLITFNVNKGTHSLELLFTETKLRLLSNIVSAIGLVIFLIYGVLVFLKSYVKSN